MSTGETKKLRDPIIVNLYEEIAKWLNGREVVVLEFHTIAITYRQPTKPVLIIYDFKRSLRPLARVVERGELSLLAPFYEERELKDRLVELLTVLTKGPATHAFGIEVVSREGGVITYRDSSDFNHHTHPMIEPPEIESFHSSTEPTDVASLLDKHFERRSSGPGQEIPVCHWGDQRVQMGDSVLTDIVNHDIATHVSKRVTVGIDRIFADPDRK